MTRYDIQRHTSGDIPLNSTVPAVVPGPLDLVVEAEAGDLLVCGIGIVPVSGSGSIGFDMATMVGGAVVTYLSSGTGTPVTIGNSGWYIGPSATSGSGGSIPYLVQAADVSEGTVTLRLYARVSATRSINADAAAPLTTWVVNMGPGTTPPDPDPPEEYVADVTLQAATTISSSGSLDWHGRSYLARRDDGVLVLVYRRGASHMSAISNLNLRFSADNGATWTAENTTLGGAPVTGFPMEPSTGHINAGEGMIVKGVRLIMLLWRVDGEGDWPEDCKGNEISYSDDGGETWSPPVAVTISGVADQEHTYITDDWFVDPDTDDIYIGGRVYNGDNPSDSYVILVKSTDDGTTWEKVANITAPGSDTQEVGLEYLGSDTIIAMAGSLTNDETIKGLSTDMGLTWTLTNVTATPVGVSRRHKIYTAAHLKGEANWWDDPKLIMFGFTNQSPGSGHPRRVCLWVSPDKGVTWSGPHYLDTSAEDGGYGDGFYDADNDQWCSINYRGTTAAASVKQYRTAISGW